MSRAIERSPNSEGPAPRARGGLPRNLMVLYGAELLGKVLGVVVFGYLGRTLLDARYGDLEFAFGILFVLNLVIDAGLAQYGARELAKSPSKTDELVGQIVFVRIVLVAISLVLLAGIAWALPRDGLARALILLQGAALLPAPLILTWVFQARDQMHVAAVASLIRQVLLAVGVFLLVKSPPDVWIVPLADAGGLLVAIVFQIVLYMRSGGVIRPLRFARGVRKVAVESAPLAASSVVWALRLFFPLLALGIFRTSAEIGVFGAGHRLVIAAHTFVWLYFFNLLPTLSRLADREDLKPFATLYGQSMKLVSWVALCGASIGSVVAPIIIGVVYGEALSEAGQPFGIMVWMLAIAFVSGHQRFSLIAFSLQKKEFWASAAGAMVSLGACLALGSRLTPVFAAMVFITAEFTTLTVSTLLLRASVPSVRALGGLQIPLLTAFVGLAVVRAASVSPFESVLLLTGTFLIALVAFDRAGARAALGLARQLWRPSSRVGP